MKATTEFATPAHNKIYVLISRSSPLCLCQVQEPLNLGPAMDSISNKKMPSESINLMAFLWIPMDFDGLHWIAMPLRSEWNYNAIVIRRRPGNCCPGVWAQHVRDRSGSPELLRKRSEDYSVEPDPPLRIGLWRRGTPGKRGALDWAGR